MPDSNITKKALAGAMKELMAQEPFAKISVGDVCQACGMSRKSFYYHFRDKYDLVNWIFYTEFIESVQQKEFRDSWEFLSNMCRYFYRERDFYRSALQIEGQNSFRDYFCEVIGPCLDTFTRDLFSDRENHQFYVTFFSDAFLASILRWLLAPAPMEPERYLSQLRRFAVRAARLVLEDLSGEAPAPG